MNKKHKIGFFIVLSLGVVLLAVLFLQSSNIAVLNPKGDIAAKERDLIVFASLLSLLVVVPVFALTFFIAWKYRASNTKAKYSPDWDHHKVLESLWWGIPFAIILILAVVAWRSSHELDPHKPLASNVKPVTIQVVALQWKWLFIYPEQDIATVNFVQFPIDTPLNFEITSDAPMNSFWIPQLGGQIYAMPGMKTKLHLQANESGSFAGSSANISGEGFSGMRFTAKASSLAEFDQWVQWIKGAPNSLSFNKYNELTEPSKNNSVTYYSSAEKDLHHRVIMKFMEPESEMRDIEHGSVQSLQHTHGGSE